MHLDSIDAPERDQPQGAEATAALTQLVAGKNVIEQWVMDGQACAYRYFLKDRDYCRWEDSARRAHRGLWSLPPESWIYPSDWRRLQKHEIASAKDFSHETVEHCLAAVGKR